MDKETNYPLQGKSLGPERSISETQPGNHQGQGQGSRLSKPQPGEYQDQDTRQLQEQQGKSPWSKTHDYHKRKTENLNHDTTRRCETRTTKSRTHPL